MKRSSSSPAALVAAALLLALVVAINAPRASAVVCLLTELRPCLPALMGPPKPSPECCTKLNEQKPCFCGYLKDPALKKFWSNPNAKLVAGACRIPFPPRC